MQRKKQINKNNMQFNALNYIKNKCYPQLIPKLRLYLLALIYSHSFIFFPSFLNYL